MSLDKSLKFYESRIKKNSSQEVIGLDILRFFLVWKYPVKESSLIFLTFKNTHI